MFFVVSSHHDLGFCWRGQVHRGQWRVVLWVVDVRALVVEMVVPADPVTTEGVEYGPLAAAGFLSAQPQLHDWPNRPWVRRLYNNWPTAPIVGAGAVARARRQEGPWSHGVAGAQHPRETEKGRKRSLDNNSLEPTRLRRAA